MANQKKDYYSGTDLGKKSARREQQPA